VLSVSVKGEKVYIELKAGPGKETATGAITPAGPARVEVNVSFSRHEAQRLALAVLAYLQAWEVVRMMTHRQQAGRMGPYELVPASSNGLEPAARNGAGGAVYGPQTASPEAPPARPVTRKGMAAGNGVPRKRDVVNGRTGAEKRMPASPVQAVPLPPPTPVLTYGDGSQVDADNVTEVQTFMMYQGEKKGVPADRSALLAYYQARAQGMPRKA
jgi:hypothetical protein